MMTTNRLYIRRFRASDWEDLYAYLSIPDVVLYEPYGVQSQEDCKKLARSRAKSKSFYAVCLKDTDRMIGNVYLGKHPYLTWELGYIIHPNFQRQGFAREATEALMAYVFETLKGHRIIACCSVENVASWKLMESIGMRHEATELAKMYWDRDANGNKIYRDIYTYAMLASEYFQKK